MSTASASGPPRGGPRRPQQARSRLTRRRVVEAAGELFEERGYDETTTAEIARRAGVSVGSVYGYFVDKREILLEILHETVEQMAEEILARLEPARWLVGDPRRPLRELIHAVFTTRRLRPGLQRILWERFFKDPQVREAMETIEGRVQGAVQELLVRLGGQGIGSVRDPASTAFVVYTATEWVAARLMLGGAPDERVEAAVETTTEMIARLILEPTRG